MIRAAAAALAALALAGCPQGQQGTIALELATAPGSTILDAVTQLRVTITRPRQVFLVDRTDRGFDLVLDLDATGITGAFVIEGFDASGGLVASGASPLVPFTGIDARVVVYLAPPMSLGAAPEALEPMRRAPSVAALPYGAVLAGGESSTGAPLDHLQIYNAYDHSLVDGLALPGPRFGVATGAGANGSVHLFGGRDATGAATGTAWRFDTTVQPRGAYLERGDFPALARIGARAVWIGAESFLITGDPIIQIAGTTIRTLDQARATGGASTTDDNGALAALLLDDASGGNLVPFRNDALGAPLAVQKPESTLVALPGGRIGAFGGTTPEIVVFDATSHQVAMPGQLASPAPYPVVAATSRHVVAVGADLDLEVLDAGTLQPIAVIPNDQPFTAAVALANDQVLLVGESLQLFTPPPPSLE
ncbi:MAG: hypothetical protein ACTHU0_00435 [Kofleriaceae bacterium]